jgi:arsenate reductase-like glutaredoxin family protein
MIKRPVLDLRGKLLVGFKPELYESELEHASFTRKHIRRV